MLLPWNNLEILKQTLELWPRRVVEDDGARSRLAVSLSWKSHVDSCGASKRTLEPHWVPGSGSEPVPKRPMWDAPRRRLGTRIKFGLPTSTQRYEIVQVQTWPVSWCWWSHWPQELLDETSSDLQNLEGTAFAALSTRNTMEFPCNRCFLLAISWPESQFIVYHSLFFSPAFLAKNPQTSSTTNNNKTYPTITQNSPKNSRNIIKNHQASVVFLFFPNFVISLISNRCLE